MHLEPGERRSLQLAPQLINPVEPANRPESATFLRQRRRRTMETGSPRLKVSRREARVKFWPSSASFHSRILRLCRLFLARKLVIKFVDVKEWHWNLWGRGHRSNSVHWIHDMRSHKYH